MVVIKNGSLKCTKLLSTFALLFSCSSYAEQSEPIVTEIGNIIIPQAFSSALRNGMSIPLQLHLNDNGDKANDQRIGTAFIWLDGSTLKVRSLQLEEQDDHAILNDSARQQLAALVDEAFDKQSKINISDDTWLDLNFKQLVLQLVIKKSALGTALKQRNIDIGESSVDKVSSTLNYNLGLYGSRQQTGNSNSSSYVSLNNMTAYKEHHLVVNGSLYNYGVNSNNRSSSLNKVMYERDFAGYRFATGMLDAWNLQSLGSVSAIYANRIYGVSFGNRASSTKFDNTQSLTPIILFFSSAGEAHVTRDGRLLSIQNFLMGNHELDTRSFPYGIYDVEVEILVNGQVVDKQIHRINKLLTPNNSLNTAVNWQLWGGRIQMDEWANNEQVVKASQDWLVGASLSGTLLPLGWSATTYMYDEHKVAESQLSLPITDNINVSTQNMIANDHSWRLTNQINVSLPGNFSSVWVNQDRTVVGDRLRLTDSYNRSIGGTVNLGRAWSYLGSLTTSYNNDLISNNKYYNLSYQQMLFSNKYGSLNMRTGLNYHDNNRSERNKGKYIAFDFSLPLGNWLSGGLSTENGYTTANLAARKSFQEGSIRSVGVNVSQALTSSTNGYRTTYGGAYTQFDTKYSSGTVNVNTSSNGYINTNLNANGSIGWQGMHLAASGRNDGSAGIIFNTNLFDDGVLSAQVNGRNVLLTGKNNYLPLTPYERYEIEIRNHKESLNSYNIASGRKTKLTLYPGNVAVIEPEIKNIVTIFGRIHTEDGAPLSNVTINNHISRTKTDNKGEFSLDVDKKYPTISFKENNKQLCEAKLDLNKVQGAAWVGDVTCFGLKTHTTRLQQGESHAS